jgi:hypothetical protein
MKKSSDTIGNQARDLLACSAVPQPTAPLRAPCCTTIPQFKFTVCPQSERTCFETVSNKEQQQVPVSTLARRCNSGNHTRQGGPGSDIIVSMKSLTVTFTPCIITYGTNRTFLKTQLMHFTLKYTLKTQSLL